MGAAAIVVGVVAILGTAGMAIPVVETASMAGSCSALYGVSNMTEGAYR